MPEITVDKYSCVQCGQCVLNCPGMLFTRKNWSETPSLVPNADAECINCAHCVVGCPVGAITVGEITRSMCQSIPKESIPRFEHISSLVRMRRSIRHFADKQLEKSKIENLLDIVRWAPSARNGLPVKWAIVYGREKMQELGALIIDWMRNNEMFRKQVEAWDDGKDMVLRGAPVLAVAYTDSSATWPEVDCTIAVQTLDFCAAAMRLGSCWAGYFIRAAQNDPKISDWLGLQKTDKVQAALMLGYIGPEAYTLIPHRPENEVRWVY